MARLRGRFLRLVPWPDAALATGLLIAALAATALDRAAVHPLADLAAALVAASVALRTRAPRAMVVLAAVALQGVPGVSGVLWLLVAVLLIAFSAGLARPPRSAAALLGVLLASAIVLQARDSPPVEAVLAPLVLIGGPGLAGALVRRYRQRARREQALVAAIGAEQDRHRALAAETERLRLARDLHDILGHTLTVVVVQAGAAESLLGDGDTAGGLVRAAGDAARDALGEVRSLIALARSRTTDPVEAAEPVDAPAARSGRGDSVGMAAALGVAAIACVVLGRTAADATQALLFPILLLVPFLTTLLLRGRRAAVTAALVLGAGFALPDDQTSVAGRILAPLILLGGPLLAGLLVARARDQSRRLRGLAGRLRDEQADSARLAAQAERARIAHDLHDVLAHTLSTVAVQAAAAQQLLDPRHPAAGPVDAIVAEARRALAEVRSLLAADGRAPAAPVPSLDRLPELVAAAGAALVVRGDERSISAGASLAAFRVVQEALTNARRHAPGRRSTVTLDYTDEGLQLRIETDGAPTRPGGRQAAGGGGRGLIGMAERVQAHDGTLTAGPAPGGSGWVVAATLPAAAGLLRSVAAVAP